MLFLPSVDQLKVFASVFVLKMPGSTTCVCLYQSPEEISRQLGFLYEEAPFCDHRGHRAAGVPHVKREESDDEEIVFLGARAVQTGSVERRIDRERIWDEGDKKEDMKFVSLKHKLCRRNQLSGGMIGKEFERTVTRMRTGSM